MSTYQLYEILKSVEGVTEEQAREAMDGIIYVEDVATKDDIRDIESRMATKDDLKNMESRMAIKDVVRSIESKILTKKDLVELKILTKKDLKEFENKMLKWRRIHSAIIIAATGLAVVILKLVT